MSGCPAVRFTSLGSPEPFGAVASAMRGAGADLARRRAPFSAQLGEAAR